MMRQSLATVLENVALAARTFRIRLAVPEIAKAIRPGQFVMLRLPHTSDPLLGRPFALYDIVTDREGTSGSADEPKGIDIVYLVVGKMTSLLAGARPGDLIEVWGPLGNGFLPLGEVEQATFVAGGIGQTPFLAYAKELLGKQGYRDQPPRQTAKRIVLYYGVRSAELAAGVADFERADVETRLASDDGSIGFHGLVTQQLARDNPPGPWIGCGPEPMLHALRTLAAERGVTCHVSLETPMACGFGVCFSCVTKLKTADGWDYKRVCIDGPVFDAKQLID